MGRPPTAMLILLVAALAAGVAHAADTEAGFSTSQICARVHNNTALEGIAPTSLFLGNAFECQRKCVQMYPECTAIVYYFVRNDTKHHYCYLFNQNSASGNVSLIEQKPPTKKDLIRMLELVTNCHEFDAYPPIQEEEGEGYASSSDRVDRKKRHDGEEIDAGEWTDWSPCSETGDATTRTRECTYGRRIEKRGCPARRPLQQMPPQQQHQQQPFGVQPGQPQGLQGGHSAVLAPVIRTQQTQPVQQLPQIDPRQQISPNDPQAQLYAERAANYRPRMRHPAIPQAVPCTGPRCPVPVRRQEAPRPLPVAPPMPPAPTHAPLPAAPSRYRPAPPPAPNCNSPGCVPTRAPLGQWFDWSDWSTCSCTCGDGVMQRRRECNGGYCVGDEYEEGKCSMGPCQTWSEWCEWSECRNPNGQNCGRGMNERTRYCLLGTQRCEGNDYESRECDLGACPEWSDWEQWTACSVSCGDNGRRSRQRSCLGGIRGDECPGPRQEDAACEPQAPCAFWAPWSDWGLCSVSCGRGNKRRSRVCQHGTDCVGESEETTYCDEAPCAQWTEWCEWSDCSATCGPGQRDRSRMCMGSDGQESRFCLGAPMESQACEGTNCCAWSEWCGWSDCDKRCGGGLSSRTRVCERNGLADPSCHCDGSPQEDRTCNPQPCEPKCNWTEWCAWSDCSTTLQCEVGVQLRSRQCVGESGCECIGLAEENQQCRGLNPCPKKEPC